MAGTDDRRGRSWGSWRGWAAVVAVLGLLAVIAIGVATAPAATTDRADALASRLRCPVCQGVSVAESRSDTALAMQDRIRQMVDQGANDDEILAHFTARYGRWVLLDPADSGAGWLLWLLPGMAVAAGAVIVARRRRRPTPPTVDEHWRRAIRREVDRQRQQEDAGTGSA